MITMSMTTLKQSLLSLNTTAKDNNNTQAMLFLASTPTTRSVTNHCSLYIYYQAPFCPVCQYKNYCTVLSSLALDQIHLHKEMSRDTGILVIKKI